MRWGIGAFALFIACSDVEQDPGLDATLQVTSAQFRRGTMPGDGAGPTVVEASISHLVTPGIVTNGGAGTLGPTGTALAVQLEGDIGWWTVTAGVPGSATPENPSFAFNFGVAVNTPARTRNVVLRAVDLAGHFGPAELRELVVAPSTNTPTGVFVISLVWDSQADLNLHVDVPNGVEIWNRNPAEYIPKPISAGPEDKLALHDGGILDHDSNARCIADGQREEDVVWNEPPAAGHYIVRVDTFSLCGGSGANWRLDAVLNGASIGSASGISTENDLRFDHGRGGGVLALEFDLP